MSTLKGGLAGWLLRQRRSQIERYRMQAESYAAEPRHKRGKVRCPVCNRKLKLSKAGLYPNHYGGGSALTCAGAGRKPE